MPQWPQSFTIEVFSETQTRNFVLVALLVGRTRGLYIAPGVLSCLQSLEYTDDVALCVCHTLLLLLTTFAEAHMLP